MEQVTVLSPIYPPLKPFIYKGFKKAFFYRFYTLSPLSFPRARESIFSIIAKDTA